MKSMGIDIGARSIRILEVDFSGRKKIIRSAYEIDSLSGQSVQELLSDFFKKTGAKPDRITVGLGDAPVVVTKSMLPFKDSKKVEQALSAEFEDLLPVDIEEHIVEAQNLGRKGRQFNFQAGIIKRDKVQEINKVFEEINVLPHNYCLHSEALARLALEHYGRKEEESTLICLCHISFKHTEFSIMEIPAYPKKKKLNNEIFGNSILEIRNIGRGSYDLYEWLDRHNNMSFSEVDQWLLQKGSLLDKEDPGASTEEKKASDEIKTALKPLLVEFYQTVQSFSSKNERRPDYFLLSGGLNYLKGFGDFFSQELRSPVVLWDSFEGFDSSNVSLNPAQSSQFSVALSLANRYGPTKNLAWLNFRRSARGDRRVLSTALKSLWKKEHRPLLLGYSIALLLIYLLSFASQFLNQQKLDKLAGSTKVEMRKLRATTRKSKEDIIAKPHELSKEVNKLMAAQAKVTKKSVGSTPRIEILRKMSQVFPPELVLKKLSIMEASGKARVTASIEAKGSTLSERHLDTLKTALLSKNFEELKIQKKGSRSVELNAFVGAAEIK